jgi:hypothetical protein
VTPRTTYMTYSRMTPAMRAALRARFSQRFRGFGLKPPK